MSSQVIKSDKTPTVSLDNFHDRSLSDNCGQQLSQLFPGIWSSVLVVVSVGRSSVSPAERIRSDGEEMTHLFLKSFIATLVSK